MPKMKTLTRLARVEELIGALTEEQCQQVHEALSKDGGWEFQTNAAKIAAHFAELDDAGRQYVLATLKG